MERRRRAVSRTEGLKRGPLRLGYPHLEEQERRDRVPAGTYGKLYDMGQLEVAEGLRVQPPVVDVGLDNGATWGKPLSRRTRPLPAG